MDAEEGQKHRRCRVLASGGSVQTAVDVKPDVHGSEVRRAEWLGHKPTKPRGKSESQL